MSTNKEKSETRVSIMLGEFDDGFWLRTIVRDMVTEQVVQDDVTGPFETRNEAVKAANDLDAMLASLGGRLPREKLN